MTVQIDGVVALTRLRGGDVLAEVWRVRDEAWEGLDADTALLISDAVLAVIPTWMPVSYPGGWHGGIPNMRAYAALSVARALLRHGGRVRLTRAERAVVRVQERGRGQLLLVWPGVMLNPATGDLEIVDEPSQLL